MALKVPPPPPLANSDPALNRWLIEIQSILNANGTVNIGDSPVLTGDPTAPTAPPGTNTTQIATTAFVLANGGGIPSTTVPLVDAGTGAIGTSTHFARGDHVHPTDGSRAPLASPALSGVPTAPTAALSTASGQLATTNFVIGQLATVAPLVDGAAAVGTSLLGARQDHVHPTDGSRAPVASPTFTGTPAAPTAAPGTSTTQLASTAFVAAAVAPLAPLASPGLTGTPTAPTAPLATNTTQIATTAFVLANASGGGGGLSVLRDYIAGLTLSTAGSSATFGVSAGTAADSTNAVMMTLAAPLAKTTAAWVAGNGGALDTGTIAANTWYWAFEIENPTTGVVDATITKAVAAGTVAPTLPSGFTLFRYLGSMKTNASSQWILFRQNGDVFTPDAPVTEASGVGFSSTAAVLLTLAGAPPGVRTRAYGPGWLQSLATGGSVLVTSPDQTDTTPTSNIANFATPNSTINLRSSGWWTAYTNTSGVLRYRINAFDANTLFNLVLVGYEDTRGRFA